MDKHAFKHTYEHVIVPPGLVLEELLTENGEFPNNPRLPALLYKKVILLKGKGEEEFIEELFAFNEWSNAWRDSIYPFHHYHSNTHEVMAITCGQCRVAIGGDKGPEWQVEAGDILVIPAGVAHRNLESSQDFKCVGAYPFGADYDIRRGLAGERPAADEHIQKAAFPSRDPVYGPEGALIKCWKHPAHCPD
jgi:uncharacterized protein YjlB